MATSADQHARQPVGLLPLWFGLLAGPLAWSAHLLISYFAVPLVCASGLEIVLYVVTAVTAVATLAAVLVAWGSWRKVRGAERANGNPITWRTARFMALSGALLSGFFLLAILAQGLPVLLQDPCAPLGGLGI